MGAIEVKKAFFNGVKSKINALKLALHCWQLPLLLKSAW
jgi:hypothetical protein